MLRAADGAPVMLQYQTKILSNISAEKIDDKYFITPAVTNPRNIVAGINASTRTLEMSARGEK
ncbi:MAG: hypothetical protein DDT40_01810 [candidate division WS2 bacterium]|nr:hypothetical protein [Candidatus Psychracetigena formicireducens]